MAVFAEWVELPWMSWPPLSVMMCENWAWTSACENQRAQSCLAQDGRARRGTREGRWNTLTCRPSFPFGSRPSVSAAVVVDERRRGRGGGGRGGATWEDDPVALARARAQRSPWEAGDVVATARARAQQVPAPVQCAPQAPAPRPPQGRPCRHNGLCKQ